MVDFIGHVICQLSVGNFEFGLWSLDLGLGTWDLCLRVEFNLN